MIDVLPPSPTPSVVDSLDGIDDLDAFLDAKGRLSRFPTPPPKKEPTVRVTTLPSEDESDGESDDEDGMDESSIAQLFASQCSPCTTAADIDSIRTFIVRAQLPVEVLALSLNILTELGPHQCQSLGHPDLLVLSSLVLADIQTNDHALQLRYWSSDIAEGRLSASVIDASMLKLLSALDWRLHGLSAPDAIRQALCKLAGLPLPSPPRIPDIYADDDDNVLAPPPLQDPLKHLVEDSDSCWAHGQLTPASSETDLAFGGCNFDPSINSFASATATSVKSSRPVPSKASTIDGRQSRVDNATPPKPHSRRPVQGFEYLRRM